MVLFGKFLRAAVAGVLALFCLHFAIVARAQGSTARVTALDQANARIAAAAQGGAASSGETRAMLSERYAQLEKVFRATPAEARSYALDAGTRNALLKADASYAALLERDGPQTGELALVIGDDFTGKTATPHYMLHTMTADLALSFTTDHGASLDRMLHHQVTVSGLGLTDVIAAETIREASPAEIRSCGAPANSAGSSALSRLSGDLASLLRPAVINPGAATAVCSTTGNQTTAILILNFAGGTATYPANYGTTAYWNTVFNGADPSVANLVKEASYGQTTAVADVYGPITVPGVFDCATTDAMTAAAFTAATGTVDFTKYNRYILVFPSTTCNFGGLDTLGCLAATATVPQQYSVMWMPVPQTYTATFPTTMYAGVGHEYGHALGLNHSNSLDFGALTLGPLDYPAANPGTVIGGGNGTTGAGAPPTTAATPAGTTNIAAVNTEYGDNYAGMGNPWSPAGPFAGQHKAQILGWIPPANAQVVTTSGTYAVAPVEATTGVRTLQVLRDATSSSWVWVEYHQSLGVYEPLSLAALQTNNLTTGAQLRYQDGLGKPLYTLLMDMAPTTSPNNFFNSNLVPGASWSDPFSLLTITAGTPTAGTQPLTISYDTPCATVALSASTLAVAGGTGTVNITAPTTCNWSVSSNATWITFPGATTGTGNATVTFNYAANTGTAQRNSYITAQRQSLPVVQSGTNISVLTVTPNSAVMAPNVMTAYTFTITDPLGAADFAQFNVNFVGGTLPDCAVTVNANGTTNSGDMTLTLGAVMSAVLTTGNVGTLTNSACTLDGPGSSYAVNGNTITITLAVSFPAAYLGVHPITSSAAGQATFSPTVPLGFVNVANITAATPAVTLTPGFGNQGTTVPITLTGTNTSFGGASVITLAGSGGTANGITVTGTIANSATSLTANLVIPTTATAGPYTVTVTTGAQVATTTFTVNTPPTPTVTITPVMGDQNTTVPFTITGINTNFSVTTTVTGGTGMTVTGLTPVNATTLTGSFVIGAAAATGPQTVTITTGTQVSTATFTVNAAGVPSIVIAPASGTMGSTVPVTITGTNTTFLAGSTVAISGADVTATNVAFGSATSLTANIVMANTADAGPRTVTVTSGAEVDTAIFTVLVAPTPRVTISPASGSTGSTVPITITGVNTNFSVATTIGVSGTGITVANVAGRDAGFLNASLIIAPTAAAGPYTVTITSGTQVVTTTFTVQALTATTTTLSASATTVAPGQTLNLKAVVSAAAGTPAGTVTFYDQISTSPQLVMRGTLPLAGGTVTLPLTGLSLGTHIFSLQYAGDNVTFAPSNAAGTLTVTVAPATPGVTLTGVPAGTIFPAGATGLSFSSVVSGGTTGLTPSGTVSFLDGTTLLSKVNVTAGTATLTGVTLATGTHSITASYSGDANFTTFTTAAQAVAVQDFSMGVNPASLTFTGSQSLVSTLTVTPGTGGFTQSIALSCTGAPANSVCNVSSTSTTPGTAATMLFVTVDTTARHSIEGKTGVAMVLFGSLCGMFLVRRRRKVLSVLLTLMVVAGLGMSVGCSGTQAPVLGAGTAAGTYTLTISGTAGTGTTDTHTATITMVVN